VVNGGNCRLAGINWVHYVHAAYRLSSAGSAARRAKGTLTYRRDVAAERLALREARVVICNSRRTREDVVARVGVDPARACVVYYGSDPVRFSLVSAAERARAKAALARPADRPLVGFVGALGDRRKAFDSVFAAWTSLCRDRAWDADLIVVGTGAERLAWERRARECGVAERIRFLGFRHDVPAVLAALDGFVHPARYEAYGLSVREALCRGVPAIVSASAGVAEHYPPELADLLIVDPDDRDELRGKLLAWRRDIERLRSAVAPLSESLRGRTWEMMAAEIADCVHAS
jgi:glycosyltransferase involved in cell wall biosynthesis